MERERERERERKRKRRAGYILPRPVPTPEQEAAAAERSRKHSWTAPAVTRVTHPERGSVVVPCRSKLSAVLCAAEVWGCDWKEILGARVEWVPEGTKAALPPRPIA